MYNIWVCHISHVIHRDAERKRRVKQIEGWLQEERHDAKIERIKKNK